MITLQSNAWILTALVAGIFTLERMWAWKCRCYPQDTWWNAAIALLFFGDVVLLSPFLR
jgi:hypothetical protein